MPKSVKNRPHFVDTFMAVMIYLSGRKNRLTPSLNTGEQNGIFCLSPPRRSGFFLEQADFFTYIILEGV